MNTQALRHMAKLLRELHVDGTLVLPNAWDAASAAVLTTESPRLDYASLNSLFSTPDLVEE
jgi:hypothetical protein